MEKEVQQSKEGQECSGRWMDLSGVVRVSVVDRVAFE